MAIHQSVTIPASPERVYNALMSGKDFGEATRAPAEIAKEEGGTFSCFGGQVTGRHVELCPNRRIIQAWRVGPWPEGKYSIVKFELSRTGDATTVDLEHTGYPDDAQEHLDSGWHKMYWEPLRAFFE